VWYIRNIGRLGVSIFRKFYDTERKKVYNFYFLINSYIHTPLHPLLYTPNLPINPSQPHCSQES
jgi:hypothetical protein